jgi:hypothetical protein
MQTTLKTLSPDFISANILPPVLAYYTDQNANSYASMSVFQFLSPLRTLIPFVTAPFVLPFSSQLQIPPLPSLPSAKYFGSFITPTFSVPDVNYRCSQASSFKTLDPFDILLYHRSNSFNLYSSMAPNPKSTC